MRMSVMAGGEDSYDVWGEVLYVAHSNIAAAARMELLVMSMVMSFWLAWRE